MSIVNFTAAAFGKISKVTCGLLPHSIYLRLLHLMKSCRKMHQGAGKFDLKNDPRWKSAGSALNNWHKLNCSPQKRDLGAASFVTKCHVP